MSIIQYYISKSNNCMFESEGNNNSTTFNSALASAMRTSSRPITSRFDIRSDYLICSQVYKCNDKIMMVTSGTAQITREEVLSLSAARQDDLVLYRILSHTDLSVNNDKYYRSCYSNYISDSNIASGQRKRQMQVRHHIIIKVFESHCI